MKTLFILYIVFTVIVSLCQCQLSDIDLTHNNGHPDNKTTTTTTTTTTTKKPTTTTTTTTTEPPKTTTQKPEPPVIAPPLIEGNITNGKNDICLRYHFSLLMRLGYMDKNNKTQVEDIWLPKSAHVDSDHCGRDKSESFWFVFDNNSTLNLTFEQNEASVYLASIYASVQLPKSNETVIVNITQPNPNFNVDKSHSYVCANNVTIKWDNNDHHTTSEFLFSNLTMQAFMKPSQKGSFSEEHNCQNEINDVVPIAVGAALTVLVIIVMIAYFIGRRVSRRLSYQSV
ncbi:Lysosome-associated membrane glycoprotein 1 [Dermatophagoides farinae]|uniref:Lysosome-associated membrane glycoprotein 5 n=1 Tax=Dermatophagoides farinae TaxID=6954 RepID=A0A922I6B9_DERFA|nr:Lysosome-associated membrane glycoprotein 1 [Dermatophagoides farinae]